MPVFPIGRPGTTLRPLTDADQPFLLHLYGTTREVELQATGWTHEQKAQFVQMQFDAQQRAYFAYPGAAFFVIEQDGAAAGRLYLQQREDALLIIDISLVPERCGAGIGHAVISAVFAQAVAVGKRVQIHVERFNPALRLYQRMGFQLVEDKGVYLFLEWDGATAQTAASV